jgi:hypothetical protein
MFDASTCSTVSRPTPRRLKALRPRHHRLDVRARVRAWRAQGHPVADGRQVGLAVRLQAEPPHHGAHHLARRRHHAVAAAVLADDAPGDEAFGREGLELASPLLVPPERRKRCHLGRD